MSSRHGSQRWGHPMCVAFAALFLAGTPPYRCAAQQPSTATATATSTRSAINQTLTAMTTAARAGDPAAYLSHVIPAPIDFGDGVQARFRKEQENWAKDLNDHTPLDFNLSIGSGDSSFGADRAAFELVMTYRMDTGAATRTTTASWPAVFVRQTSADGDSRWFYAGEDWVFVAAPNLTVAFFPGSEPTARDVLTAFPIAKAHDDEGFEVVNITPQVIKLYTDMEHLKATVYLSMPDRILGGWNEPGESIKFMASYTRGVDRWAGALAHEYGHVDTWELGPRVSDMPWWVHEGVAELAAAALVRNYPQATDGMIRSLAARGRLAKWDDLASYRTAPAPLKHLAYHQGYSLIAFVSERWGRAGRNAWLRAMAHGSTLDQATRDIFKMSFAELDERWRSTLPAADEPSRAKDSPAPAEGGGSHSTPAAPPVPTTPRREDD